MITPVAFLLTSVALSLASPLERRVVTSLNQAAFEEAQQRDDTATRAFSGTEIKTSGGKCLFVDELSGDFRANLNPIQVAACDGSTGQKWDVITAGKHNDQTGTMLIINTRTQACANFDPRRKAGNTVIMFSCGGRADGGGGVTDSQLLGFAGGAGPLSLEPQNAAGTCLTVTDNVLDSAACRAGDAAQSFTFGGASDAVQGGGDSAKPSAVPTHNAALPVTTQEANSPAAIGDIPSVNPTTPVPVSRAGGTLNPSSAAEAQQRDDTATRAFTSVSLESANGQCLTIDPTAGDFRQNLIPIAVQPCTGSPNQKFDLVTKGRHIDAPGSTLVVSALMQGCLTFDPRRAAGDTAHVFSCGGRADGEGAQTDSQLFAFQGGDTITLAPLNGGGTVCLVPHGARLDQATCSGAGDVYTIVQ